MPEEPESERVSTSEVLPSFSFLKTELGIFYRFKTFCASVTNFQTKQKQEKMKERASPHASWQLLKNTYFVANSSFVLGSFLSLPVTARSPLLISSTAAF